VISICENAIVAIIIIAIVIVFFIFSPFLISVQFFYQGRVFVIISSIGNPVHKLFTFFP